MTHEAITKNLLQDNWKDKLEPYSGPQCNEDRGNKNKCDYNPNLNKKLEQEQSLKKFRVLSLKSPSLQSIVQKKLFVILIVFRLF